MRLFQEPVQNIKGPMKSNEITIFAMSLTRVIDVPEVETAVSKLINNLLHVCQGYRQVQMRCLSDELNLPIFARLFELINLLEKGYLEEFVRFQVSRGQKITWSDVKPVESIEKAKASNIVQTILEMEKEIHQNTIRLSKLAWDKGDLPLVAFLEDRFIPRQVKVIHKRANQVIDLKRSDSDVSPFLIERLNARFEVEKLEKRLRLEIIRREVRAHNYHGLELTESDEISMIGSTTQF